MTNPDPQSGGVEYPSLENSPPPNDPYAPVDYPSNYPGYGSPAPQPGYPPAAPSYPAPDQYPAPASYQPGAYPPGSPPPGYPGGYPPPPPPYPGYGSYNPYDPYDPYGQGKPPGTNGKAIAALVTAVGGLVLCGLPSIAGIILGAIAMRETKRTGQDGYGLALSGLIVGSLVVALGIMYIIFIIVVAANSSSYGTY